MTTRAIIFDYGNVLDIADDPQSTLDQRHLMAQELGVSDDDLWARFNSSDAWQQVKRGQITQAEFHDAIMRPLGVTDREAQKALIKRWYFGRDRVHAEMIAILHALQPYYRLAILSNTDIIEMDRWLAEEQELPDIFEVVVSSAQVGMAKPDMEIYHYALKALNLPASEVLFVDDLVRNTSAAEAVGIPSIVFESPVQLRGEFAARGIVLTEDGKNGGAQK